MKFAKLKNRGHVSVTGEDAETFLQNIISNDIKKLERTSEQNCLHACLLTAQGKYLHDFYVSKIEGGFVLECEGFDRTEDLAKRLNLYKLRAKISITTTDHVTIYASAPTLRTTSRPTGNEISFEEWDIERIKNAQPDGSRDAEIGTSTLAELNLDECAVSYTKGCYIGQELVARMHNRNLGKKHLVAARFKSLPPAWDVEIEGIGFMRSSCKNYGLILVNRETETKLKEAQTDDSEIYLLGL
ncbi:MAG TPA: folate-binding protein [Alphaproteobacteria bacterium]|nr:folate-binding protein YgfZ [Alphaproteobacteria bacterium]HOO50408.1 folate-binding protein [Alphaproteobacteria bacterium]